MLAYATCLDSACKGISSCGSLLNNARLTGQAAWDNADLPKLMATFPAGTHTVLIRLSCPVACGGDSTLSTYECNSGGFVDVKVISSELATTAAASCCLLLLALGGGAGLCTADAAVRVPHEYRLHRPCYSSAW